MRSRKLREVLSLLHEAGVRPSKRLGQHFLVDPRGAELFVRGLRKAGARVALEVGPGLGAITLEASRVLDRLVAVELDEKLAVILRARAPSNVSVVIGDGVAAARSFPIAHVYSNTPFNLSSEIVEAVARNSRVEAAVLGVQREVAWRIVAKPGSEEYGRLSVLSSLIFEARIIGVIPPSWYYPRPEVHTAVVLLERKRKWGPLVEVTLRLAKCLFTMRRRLASRAFEECARRIGCKRGEAPEGWGDRRVWGLGPEEIMEAAAEACAE